MKSRMIAAVAACTMLAGCVSSTLPPPPVTTKYQLNDKEMAAVTEGVRRSLKDPDSARFGGMLAAQKEPGIVYVCGTVNAKNSFGGYVGDQPYLGLLGTMEGGSIATFDVVSMGGSDIDTSTVMTMCRHYGVL